MSRGDACDICTHPVFLSQRCLPRAEVDEVFLRSTMTTMVNTPTVLILGAGASMPYGFPSGFGLLKEVQECCSGPRNGSVGREASSVRLRPELLAEMAKLLSVAPVKSIDAFLEQRDEFLDEGKFAIAHRLMPSELEDILFKLENRGDSWYQHLFDSVYTRKFEDVKRNRLSILTYNYDRSLEHFLHVSVRAIYKKGDDEVATMLTNIPVIHLHGSLGKYSCDGKGGRRYRPAETIEDLKHAMAAIKVIGEDIDVSQDPQFRRAHELFREAKRVVFLGFGYHPLNLSRLNVEKHIDENAEIFGTCKGMWPVDIANLKSNLGRLPIGVGVMPEPPDNLKFLRTHDVLS